MTEEPKLVTFPAGTTDAEKADGYRKQLQPLLDQAGALRDRARRDGLMVDFGFGMDNFGRTVTTINVVKPL